MVDMPWRVVVRGGVLLLVLSRLVGCASSPPAHVAPVALRTAVAVPRFTPQQVALAHVQAMPLYQQAVLACQAQLILYARLVWALRWFCSQSSSSGRAARRSKTVSAVSSRLINAL